MTETFLIDIQIIFRSYFITLAWAIIAWPIVSKLFSGLPDKGWALGRVLITLAIALIVWNLGLLGFRVNTDTGVLVVSAVIAVISILIFKKRKRLEKSEMKEVVKYIVIEEYLFLVGFVLMAMVRGFSPDIRSLEKFMDYGFVRRYLMSPGLPAGDMWLAGEGINYYSFGHYWASIVIRFFSVAPAYGYNLVLALMAGLGLSMSFMVASNLTAAKDKARVIGGLIGSLAVVVGGNSHAIWYFLKNLSMKGYWYANATRFIVKEFGALDNTIHEFPSYSFVVSDLHGHLLDMPVILAFLMIFIVWVKERKIVQEILMGVLVGVMMMTNTWDVAVYGLLMTIFCLVSLIGRKLEVIDVARAGIVILGSAVTVAGIWWIGFESISNGIGVVKDRSPLWQLAVLWTGGVVASILAFVTRAEEKRTIILTLLLTIFALLIIPELVYARDIYPNHPRANTMFKLTYQAFILMGLSLGAAAGQVVGGWQKKGWARAVVGLVVMAVFISGMIFPMEAFSNYYGNFREYKGLDGEKWMRAEANDYYEASLFLRENNGGKNIVEAVGDSYTDFNMVSVFSGVPTVLGWRVHEWLWRGGYEVVGQRDEEVKNIFEGKSVEEIKLRLERYNVGWVVVGPNERIKYRISEGELLKLGGVAWEGDNVYLIRVD